jgi:hypothetical protein
MLLESLPLHLSHLDPQLLPLVLLRNRNLKPMSNTLDNSLSTMAAVEE